MFVDKIIFFITISSNIQLGTVEVITDANTITLIHSVVNVIRVYKKIGFHISTLHLCGQFHTSHIRCAAAELNVTLDHVSEDEHVPEAEVYIRTIN